MPARLRRAIPTGVWRTDFTSRQVNRVEGLDLNALRSGSWFESEEWGRTAGLLGDDVLSRFTIEIDREVITLHEPASYQHTGGGKAMPMTLNGNIPTIEVTLNGKCQGTYIVDVGNSSVLSVGAEQVMKCGLLAQNSKQVEQGNLGTTILERFRCTFDYANGKLWLEPGQRFAAHEAFTRSGLSFTRWAGVVVVFRVVKDAPAEAAGLKLRDVIRAINGKGIERWPPRAAGCPAAGWTDRSRGEADVRTRVARGDGGTHACRRAIARGSAARRTAPREPSLSAARTLGSRRCRANGRASRRGRHRSGSRATRTAREPRRPTLAA